MKTRLFELEKNGLATRRRSLQAATLVDLMVSLSLGLLVMAAVLAVHLFGLRMFELTKAKLGASDEARTALGRLTTEIRTAKIIRVGDGTINSFTEVADGMAQIGSAIRVFPSTNTNAFVQYYLDGDALKRVTNNSTVAAVVANSISNNIVFRAENFRGVALTNNEDNRVIALTMQFYQLQYPPVPIGAGSYYDYYQLSTKITRRALE